MNKKRDKTDKKISVIKYVSLTLIKMKRGRQRICFKWRQRIYFKWRRHSFGFFLWTHDFINKVRHKFNVYHHAFIYAVTVDIIKCRDILSVFDSSFINVMFDAYNICAAKLTFPSKSNNVYGKCNCGNFKF